MKGLKELIQEKLKVSKKQNTYTLFPETKDELREMIEREIKKNGNNCSLNHIDVRAITDMSFLFNRSRFNGDIFYWDVSGVENMKFMFCDSKFNQDISNWEINSNCETENMFAGCEINPKYKPKDVN